jgi:hypothetical protein
MLIDFAPMSAIVAPLRQTQKQGRAQWGNGVCDKDGSKRTYLTIEDMIGSSLPVFWIPQRDLESFGCARVVSQHCALVGVRRGGGGEEEFQLHEFLAGSSRKVRPAVDRRTSLLGDGESTSQCPEE